MASLKLFHIFIILGLGLATGALGAKLLGTTECTYGPAYWCGSLRNAKQCSAVKHCIQTVWETQKLPADNDDICGICKDMVEQARDTLQSNQTQEELKEVLEGSCHLIPLKEVAVECVELADEFIPELIETLASQMNPQVVCATAGLCNSVRVDRLLRERSPLSGNSAPGNPAPGNSAPGNSAPGNSATEVTTTAATDDCSDCNRFINDYINMVRSTSKEELMDHLLEICGQLSTLSDGCSALVSVNIDAIYDFLTSQLQPDDVCQLMGMCGDLFGGAMKAQAVVKKTGDEACDFCVVIAQHWKDVLTTNTSLDEFKQVLEGLCRQTGAFRAECLSLAEQYGIAVYEYLVRDFDPKAVCEVVGICGTKKDKAVWTMLHVGPEDPSSLKFTGRDEANSYALPRVPLTPSIKISVAGESGRLPGDDQACTMCEFTLHFIQIQLQDNHTKEAIEAAVKSVCSHLPRNLREQCDDYVDAYGDQVIALLQQEIDPSVLCPMLGLCPSKNVGASPPLPLRVGQALPQADVTCVACEFIMVKIKELLQNKTDQEAVRAALDSVCGVLPHSLVAQCTKFVDENAVEVMQLIAGGVQPEHICTMLGFCSPAATTTSNQGVLAPLSATHQLPITRLFLPTQQLETRGQSKVCVLCEFVIATLDHLLLDNNTHIIEELEQKVEQVCVLLPSSVQEDCLGFIEQYGDALVHLLLQEVSPAYVCRSLRVCKQTSLPALEMPHAVSKRSATQQTPTEESCLVCKAVYNSIKGAADPASAAQQFCDKLQDSQQQTCVSIDVAALTTTAGASRTAACAALNYCAPSKGLIGSEKCTWGPSFWCQSLLHAQSCGATPHCEERVWVGGVAPA